MGPLFGADLSSVRVHTDSDSVQMNQEIGAQAFTHGEHVFYGAGKGPANDHLTAHELTHTLQQGGGRPLSRKQIQRQLADYLNARNPPEALLQPEEDPRSARKRL